MSNSIGYSLLAMAVSASMALANGGGEGDKKDGNYQTAGGWAYKPGSGLTYDGGDAFGLTLGNQLQVQWAFAANDNAPDTNNFTVRRARTTFKGHAFDRNILYMLRFDHTDTGASIKDAWVQWNFMKSEDGSIGLRTGQGKTYHGLEVTGSSSGLFFVERSATSRSLSDSRSRGAWLHGAHAENKFRWNAGAQNGDVAAGSGVFEVGEEATNPDNELTYIANASFDPLGDFTGGKTNEDLRQGDLEGAKDLVGTIGAGIMFGNHRTGPLATDSDVESTSINLNTAWKVNSFAAQAEVFLRNDQVDVPGGIDEDVTGWYIQGTYVLAKSGDTDMQWGVGLRVNQINTDDTSSINTVVGLGGAAGDVTEVTGVLDAFYHGHAAKTQLEYTWQDVNPDAGTSSTNHIIRIQFQLLF